MNIDLTIVFEDKIITLNSDKSMTSDYLISVLKKKKEFRMTEIYMLLDFYTGKNIDFINESGKLMILPQAKLEMNKIKQIPINELIRKVTKAEKPLVMKQNEKEEEDRKYNFINTIKEGEGDNTIEICLDRTQLKQILQRLTDLRITSNLYASTQQMNTLTNNNENNSQSRQYIEDTLQEALTNYMYYIIKSNEQFVRNDYINQYFR